MSGSLLDREQVDVGPTKGNNVQTITLYCYYCIRSLRTLRWKLPVNQASDSSAHNIMMLAAEMHSVPDTHVGFLANNL